MIAKRDPRSSPKHAKIIIKIDIDFGHATRVVRRQVRIVVWAGTPLQGGVPVAPRGGQAPMRAAKDIKDIKH